MVDRASSGEKPMMGRVSSGVESLVRQSQFLGRSQWWVVPVLGQSQCWCRIQCWEEANVEGRANGGQGHFGYRADCGWSQFWVQSQGLGRASSGVSVNCGRGQFGGGASAGQSQC